MNTLEGKVTLITGAKGGLGSFVTEAFLAAGAKVVGVSRSIQASDFSHPEFTAMAAELSSGEAAQKASRRGGGAFRTHRRAGPRDGRLRRRTRALRKPTTRLSRRCSTSTTGPRSSLRVRSCRK